MKVVHYLYYLLIFFSVILAAGCMKTVHTAEVTPELTSHPLSTEADLDPLLSKIGNARIVLLGESSHGTAEYYQWRATITKRLIAEKGFEMIGVEGEWADSYRVNQFIKGPAKDSSEAVTLLRQYDRWPTWMWGNYEIASLVTWLNQFNQNNNKTKKISFYGLDVYCLWESTKELLPFIKNDALKKIANDVKLCFTPFSSDPIEYAYAVANSSADCKKETQKLWNNINMLTANQTATNEPAFVMQQNALVALNGEAYYRTATGSYEESWNIRDRHMMQTIERLLQLHGADSKIIIWAHNTHVGDARYTNMADAGMVNVGQLVREKFGANNVFAVGFGSYSGTVIAADNWGGKIESMRMPAAKAGSWEYMLHRLSPDNKIIFSDEIINNESLVRAVGHRAIGVQYNPAQEAGNYVPTIIPKRYDAFIYIDKTTALRPLSIQTRNEPPDTYPSGY